MLFVVWVCGWIEVMCGVIVFGFVLLCVVVLYYLYDWYDVCV